ncbi:MAG TPA: DUF4389 domain-containing protein [Gaiellaceae bacterium]|nr:DUF4389 domain-containing protein [Gaiellaceae bacterium]
MAREGQRHPIRLVVRDDLERNRVTVLFRLLLVLPHLVVLVAFGIVAVVVGFLGWLATLFRGILPRGLHDFLAGYLRYTTHVSAYLLLAAGPYPKFFAGSRLPDYPVDLEIDPPARQRRFATLFRIVLAVPALVLAGTLTGGGSSGRGSSGPGVAHWAAVLSWFASLFRGRSPQGLRDLTAWSIGYSAQTYGYVFLLTSRYPASDPVAMLATVEPPPEDDARPWLANADDLRRSRLTVFFRLPLSAPHLVWFGLWSLVAWPAALANWLATLATGRSPAPLRRFLEAYVRYGVHLGAFLSLVGNPFPGFVGRAGSYPLDVELAAPARQSRWITCFRPVLALPALALAGALVPLLAVVWILGWFASLATGRMPEGLQQAGAFVLGYLAAGQAYGLVLSDRYPHASPLAVLRGKAQRQLSLLAGSGAAVAVLALVLAAPAGSTIVVGKGIGGVLLGMSQGRVRAVLGRPRRVVHANNEFGSYTELRYAGYVVDFQGDAKATGIVTTLARERTASGVGVGSTWAQVRARVPRVRCSGAPAVGDCHVGSFLPGHVVTDFVFRRGVVGKVVVGIVLD